MIPRATYRLQFRDGMTFERAAEIVPYLSGLGISHLYASPIFAATPGSSHGYDVADHNVLDPALGGGEGFAALGSALKAEGLGLLLDIVPNHMAVSTANPWWRDVLTHGRNSKFARHFDIDWKAPKLLLPVLGEPYGEALSEGLQLCHDAETDEFFFCYFDLELPVTPSSLDLLGEVSAPHEAVAQANGDKGLLHLIHEAQVWRLAYWRLAREALTYRRFFEIADLIGVRVEDPAVFQDVHRLSFKLIKEGVVDGLRIDHIDGLADPKAYLSALRRESGVGFVVVEKILGADEPLREDWDTEGTSGYEMARLITGLQVDSSQSEAMTQEWVRFTGEDPDFATRVLEVKRRIFTVNLAGELDGLVRLAAEIAFWDIETRDFGRDSLRRAIVELAAELPVYRTYIDASGADEQDRQLILKAAEKVADGREIEDERVVFFLSSILLDPPGDFPARSAFIARFQQTTGPLMAKAVEDTVFYRYNRLIALNEVGSEPCAFGISPAEFHRAMQERAERWPHALSATATHDTKRGEDARARLAVLSEMPQQWAGAIDRWQNMASDLRRNLPVDLVPGPSEEWLFYQALVGAWPNGSFFEDEEARDGFAQRLCDYMQKALREAKQSTSWTSPNERYEEAVEAYVRGIVSSDRLEMLRDVQDFVDEIEPAAAINSLAQVALKLTLPGVPDIYQGCELPDYSMVDPDNRRPVDYGLRQQLLRELGGWSAAEALKHWREGHAKMWLTLKLLELRREHETLFSSGSYEPVHVGGTAAEHVLAFTRNSGGKRLVVAAPRLTVNMVLSGTPLFESASLGTTALRLPAGVQEYHDLEGRSVKGSELPISELWSDFPIAVLLVPGS